jgi:hypothetical protein
MTKKKETIKLKSGECTIGGAEGQGPKKYLSLHKSYVVILVKLINII